MKVHHLLNGIMCDKISAAISSVKTHPKRYKKDFDAVVACLSHYVENMDQQHVKVASIAQNRMAKNTDDQ